MYTSIGVLQRDAPSQGHLPQFRAAQQQMAQDLLASVKAFKAILREDLPSSGILAPGNGWPQAGEVKASLEGRIGLLEGEIEQGRARLAEMQSIYDNIINENIHN